MGVVRTRNASSSLSARKYSIVHVLHMEKLEVTTYVIFGVQDFLQTLRNANPNQNIPEIALFAGFHPWLVFFDTLHVCYRGFGPDLVASVLIDVWGRTTNALANAHELAASWCKANFYPDLACEEFVFTTEGGFPTLGAKGTDIKSLLLFLDAWRNTHTHIVRVSCVSGLSRSMDYLSQNLQQARMLLKIVAPLLSS